MDAVIEKEIAGALKEILRLIRIQTMPSVGSLLRSTLSDASQQRIYQALDGTMTQKQLATTFKTSQPTVSRLLSAWQRAGIVEEAAAGKYLKSFDLKSFGISDSVE